MLHISDRDVRSRLDLDNPWWSTGGIEAYFKNLPRRAYFPSFRNLVADRSVRRAVVLMGPRRVGKTVMLQQTIGALIESGLSPRNVMYVPLDTPVYDQLGLESLLSLFLDIHKHSPRDECLVVFDEVQYLRNWEVHLKSLVDSYRGIKFIASGSSAAALRLKSRESGAGRFTDFILPPLTFAEFLDFEGVASQLIRTEESLHGWAPAYGTPDIDRLNRAFLDYLTFGAYPETVVSPAVRQDAARYIRSDIVDKVLLRDLPSLYGIDDIQELNRLFTMLAYNTASELNYEDLANSSGVAKNTLRRYLEYLEAAFLVLRVRRIDRNARRFQRDTAFKVYITNTSIRAALFGPVADGDQAMGRLAETAIYNQWMHASLSLPNIYYARWREGEVDIVQMDRAHRRVLGLVEVKWSDRTYTNPSDLRPLADFARENRFTRACLATTRTKRGATSIQDVQIVHEPCALYCYRVGHHATTLQMMSLSPSLHGDIDSR